MIRNSFANLIRTKKINRHRCNNIITKRIPNKNKRELKNTIPLTNFISCSCNPGFKKDQNCQRIYGNETIIPTKIDVTICAENCPLILIFNKEKEELAKHKESPKPKKHDNEHKAL